MEARTARDGEQRAIRDGRKMSSGDYRRVAAGITPIVVDICCRRIVAMHVADDEPAQAIRGTELRGDRRRGRGARKREREEGRQNKGEHCQSTGS